MPYTISRINVQIKHFDKLGCHTGQKNIYSKDVTTLSIKYMDEGKL